MAGASDRRVGKGRPDWSERPSTATATKAIALAGANSLARGLPLALARLGLRGGEVAALTPDDLDWDTGLVTLSGKGAAARGAAPARRRWEGIGGLSAGRPPAVRDAACVRSRNGPAPGLQFHGGRLRRCMQRPSVAEGDRQVLQTAAMQFVETPLRLAARNM